MELSTAIERPEFPSRAKYDAGRQVLVGSECKACGTRSWPGRSVCNRCGSPDLVEADLAVTGALIAYTIVHVARPGLPAPYILGQVLLQDGVRIYSHVRGLGEQVRVPVPVQLTVASEEDALPRFWFEPVAGDD